MTWTKLSDDFTDQCAELSDAALRTHVDGLVWCMKQETGGFISAAKLKRVTEARNPKKAASELVEQGFWQQVSGGYQVVHHMEHQPSPEEIQARRKKDAEKQKARRRRQLGLDNQSESPSESPGDTPGESQGSPGRGGTGRGDITPLRAGRSREVGSE